MASATRHVIMEECTLDEAAFILNSDLVLSLPRLFKLAQDSLGASSPAANVKQHGRGFPQFSKFPTEVRALVWKFATLDNSFGRIVQLSKSNKMQIAIMHSPFCHLPRPLNKADSVAHDFYHRKPESATATIPAPSMRLNYPEEFRSKATIPKLWQVNREAYHAAAPLYSRGFRGRSSPGKTLFNFKTDTLFLDDSTFSGLRRTIDNPLFRLFTRADLRRVEKLAFTMDAFDICFINSARSRNDNAHYWLTHVHESFPNLKELTFVSVSNACRNNHFAAIDYSNLQLCLTPCFYSPDINTIVETAVQPSCDLPDKSWTVRCGEAEAKNSMNLILYRAKKLWKKEFPGAKWRLPKIKHRMMVGDRVEFADLIIK